MSCIRLPRAPLFAQCRGARSITMCWLVRGPVGRTLPCVCWLVRGPVGRTSPCVCWLVGGPVGRTSPCVLVGPWTRGSDLAMCAGWSVDPWVGPHRVCAGWSVDPWVGPHRVCAGWSVDPWVGPHRVCAGWSVDPWVASCHVCSLVRGRVGRTSPCVLAGRWTRGSDGHRRGTDVS